MQHESGKFATIYALVKHIPKGQVASYGMLASLLSGVTARMVGYAMAATPEGQGIPWHRVINSAGKVSERPGAERQRQCLMDEGVLFSKSGKVSWPAVRWQGPPETWLSENGMDFMEFLTIQSRWP